MRIRRDTILSNRVFGRTDDRYSELSQLPWDSWLNSLYTLGNGSKFP